MIQPQCKHLTLYPFHTLLFPYPIVFVVSFELLTLVCLLKAAEVDHWMEGRICRHMLHDGQLKALLFQWTLYAAALIKLSGLGG